LIRDKHNVEIIGPIFGNRIWAPDSKDFSYKAVMGTKFPMFFKSMIKMVKSIEGDVVIASLAMPSSFGVALLEKIMVKNISLIIDIHDWPLGNFFNLGLTSQVRESLFSIRSPDAWPYLFLTEAMTRFADEKTVFSRFLQKKFGGTYLPQFVDTCEYDPKKFDREELRRNWQITDEKIISFISTPYPHKGLEELIRAVNRIQARHKIKLMITGDERDPYMRYILSLGGEKIIFLGVRPRHEEPLYLSMADLVVVPQRLNYFTMAQVPLRLVTAMAMAKPIIATRVSDLPEILNGCGILVNPGNIDALAENISYLLDNEVVAKSLGENARKRCIEKYSFDTAKRILNDVLARCIK
jgi:glycosyltransferase involved in cell wall biosynthesis